MVLHIAFEIPIYADILIYPNSRKYVANTGRVEGSEQTKTAAAVGAQETVTGNSER